jgi:hypothetical protein
MDPELLVLCCFGQDRQRTNMEYFRTLEHCCRVRAIVTGHHDQSDDDRQEKESFYSSPLPRKINASRPQPGVNFASQN